jgi:hypothetical protein
MSGRFFIRLEWRRSGRSLSRLFVRRFREERVRDRPRAGPPQGLPRRPPPGLPERAQARLPRRPGPAVRQRAQTGRPTGVRQDPEAAVQGGSERNLPRCPEARVPTGNLILFPLRRNPILNPPSSFSGSQTSSPTQVRKYSQGRVHRGPQGRVPAGDDPVLLRRDQHQLQTAVQGRVLVQSVLIIQAIKFTQHFLVQPPIRGPDILPQF